MALIPCLDCGTQVSSAAAACPKCSRPIAAATTIEATGKRWKKIQLVGGIGLVAAVVVVIAGIGNESPGASAIGLLLFVASGALYFGARVGGWWHHG